MDSSLVGAGRMGATPHPKATIASYGNKHCKARKPTGPTASGANQRPLEDIDTVGVTGSIPVSPTKAPELLASSAPGPYFVSEVSTEPQVLCSRPIMILSGHAGAL